MKAHPLILLVSVCFILQNAFSQSSNQNYVRTRTMTNATGSTYTDKIDYYDGLGRPIQTIQVKAGGNGQDLVTQTDYDICGRQEKIWLPASIADNKGAYVAAATARSESANTNGGDSKPYVLTAYELSPLNRVAQEYGPGNNWQANSRGVRTTYLLNSTSDACGKYTCSDDGLAVGITRSGTYPAGMLYVTKLQDEDNNISYEFKDKQGQIILTRQVNASTNFDTYYVYDSYGNLRAVLPPLASDALSGNGAFVESTDALQIVSYYDNYDFIGKNGVPATLNFESKSGYAATNHPTPKGLPTGQITSQVGNVSVLFYTTNYYDTRDRQILVKSTNHLGGTDKEFVSYAFDGLPEKRLHEHTVASSTNTEEYTYTYDDARRLKTTSHKWNGGEARALSSKNYDSRGRLLEEIPGRLSALKATYSYDVRSRMASKKDAQMNESLTYTYGGNIQSQLKTTSAGQSKYEYTYDGLSRLTSAAYTSGPGNFATSYNYDKHGNPQSITRYGMTSNGVYGLIDDMSNNAVSTPAFMYNGNLLIKVNDHASDIPYSFSHDFKNYTSQSVEYTYNLNGSMTKDMNRGISSIQYNVLNLPDRIDIKSPVGEARNEYLYCSDGEKLRVTHRWNPSYSSAPVIGSGVTESALTATETTDYIRNYIYVNNTLKRVITENGYIENNVYHYYIKDHLGSNNIVVNQSGVNVQSTSYYPFGMQQSNATGTDGQPYKYTGKEYDQKHGLNLYDYEARFYDPALCRFMAIDPMAEKYYSISPYAYCANNPVRFTDSTGMVLDDYGLDKIKGVLKKNQGNRR